MVIISGITASLVPSPNIIKIEQTNSAITAKVKVATSPNPKGSEKTISSLPKKRISFGIP